MLHVWYIYLHNWVIWFGQMLGFIFHHHGSHIVRILITGWWCNTHLEKWWSSSMGLGWHPIYGSHQSHVWNHQPARLGISPNLITIPIPPDITNTTMENHHFQRVNHHFQWVNHPSQWLIFLIICIKCWAFPAPCPASSSTFVDPRDRDRGGEIDSTAWKAKDLPRGSILGTEKWMAEPLTEPLINGRGEFPKKAGNGWYPNSWLVPGLQYVRQSENILYMIDGTCWHLNFRKPPSLTNWQLVGITTFGHLICSLPWSANVLIPWWNCMVNLED